MSLWNDSFVQNTNEINSALNFFVASWVKRFMSVFFYSWGLPGDLVNNIINKEAYLKEAPKASRKPPRKPRKISGQKSRNNLLGILEETFISYKDILKLTDLYLLRAGNPTGTWRISVGFLSASTSLTDHMVNTFYNAANITYFQLSFEINLFFKVFLKKSTNPQCILLKIEIKRSHLVAGALPPKRVLCRITSCFSRAQNGNRNRWNCNCKKEQKLKENSLVYITHTLGPNSQQG